MILRLRYQKFGAHIYCRLFTAPGPDRTFAKCGDLVFSEQEWPEVVINWEGIGYKAALTWGDMAGSVDVKLSAITVAKVKAELTDGGTVGLSLQLQCHPKQEHYGELASLIGREGVSLTLTPPTATELKKIEKSEKKKDGKKDDDAGK